MDDDAYVSGESLRRIVALTALCCGVLFALTVGVAWVVNAVDGWPVAPRDALGVTALQRPQSLRLRPRRAQDHVHDHPGLTGSRTWPRPPAYR
jgi:hypothetical protein